MKQLKKAFTLIEILVVVGIIVLLFGLLLPVFLNAKKSAYHTEAISNMRQFGAAQSIYENDNDGQMAYGVPTLITAGLASTEIASVPLDQYPKGETNAWLEMQMAQAPRGTGVAYLPFITPYKLTFFGWLEREAPLPPKPGYDKCITNQPGAGWLIDPTYPDTSPDATPNEGPMFFSQYNRLENDGSVVHRQSRYFGNCVVGKDLNCAFAFTSLFADGDDAWFASLFDKKNSCENP